MPFVALESEREVHRSHNKHVRNKNVPLHRLAKQQINDPGKHHQRDALLQDLQLRNRKDLRADAVRWNLKDVFEESNQPANDDHHD